MSHRAYTTVAAQPAAGTDWSFTPSGSDWWRLLSIVATLTTTSTAGSRSPAVTVTDQTGNQISRDTCSAAQIASSVVAYTWRPASMQYGADIEGGTVAGSIPGFWLPSDATIAADTANLDTGTPVNQAGGDTDDETANLPVTIVTGVNDTFNFTGQAGGGTPEDFVIAPGVYATTASVATAIQAAIGMTSGAFSTQATCVDGGSGDYLFIAVADIGAAGNGDVVQSAGSSDAWATIITGAPPLTFVGGADAAAGDQWTDIVATYIAADEEHWRALEALLAQINPGG